MRASCTGGCTRGGRRVISSSFGGGRISIGPSPKRPASSSAIRPCCSGVGPSSSQPQPQNLRRRSVISSDLRPAVIAQPPAEDHVLAKRGEVQFSAGPTLGRYPELCDSV